ncbi:membrane-spanning 4-domains subfamily A member 10 [Myotis myotis]|uniref:Membrane spanning 4-domains A10 n=1 Tax=Myotis myotis TaxID=51298 RepID=A0A7J7RHN4_MYOMY|nr:membrane-spanning 4-domains subfamily A member 10 [Myotis myotis]XP_036151671.1 membrane-spanning 4-domains subfamily A member 10 [Myotis myotis]KAF6275485.1 membrane spanning 4-domains A10 [Myotis myotis]
MAAEAPRAAAGVPRSGAGGFEPWQALGPAQPGQTSPPPKVTQPGHLPPDWRQERPRERRILLQALGASHVAIAVLHAVLGGYLVFAVKNLHLVALKSWYPFWGAASFLISGILAIAVAAVSKTSLKALCLVANVLSFLCVLAGLFVLAKDLFLESPFETPIWRPYPNSTVHIQRLQLALLCLTCLEFFLLGPTTAVACRDDPLSVERDDLPRVPEAVWTPQEPPPSYEDVTGGGTREEPRQK